MERDIYRKHAFVHYSSAGTGLRTLLDQRIFLKRFGGELDIKRHPYYSHHPNMVWLMRATRPFKMIKKRKRIVRELKLLKNTKPNNTDA
ncbi:MAG: hypothetical protein UH734_06695 [Ruminococcus sp.]|nr:hypothetical protein [Ruminococcus sp.]